MNVGAEAAQRLALELGVKVSLPFSQFSPKALGSKPGRLIDHGNENYFYAHQDAKIGELTQVTFAGHRNLVFVGRNAYLRNASIQMRGSSGVVIFCGRAGTTNGQIKVSGQGSGVVFGRRSSWGGGSIMASEGRMVIVADDCMLSNDITIRTSDSHGIFDQATRARLNPGRDVIVEEHVWLGNGVRVNKGSRVARGSVVGQGSIVAGHLESPCAVYAGVPAVLKRSGIAWSRTGRFEDVPEAFR